jgi:hypothetical protein
MKDQEELNTEDQVHDTKETVQEMIKEHIQERQGEPEEDTAKPVSLELDFPASSID